MTHARLAFWNHAHPLLQGDTPWSARCEALTRLVDHHQQGHALVDAGSLPDCTDNNAVAPVLPLQTHGYRAFLKSWEAGEETGIHGHPNTMFVYVISATLESIGYLRDGERLTEAHTITKGAGQTLTGYADNARNDNFIHTLRCVAPGWSLHIYSDAPERGERFDPL